MTIRNYFEENGFVYGVSSKCNYRRWSHMVHRFNDFEKARKWLHTEQRSFRERELCTAEEAIALAGKEAVKTADMLFMYETGEGVSEDERNK